MNEVLLEKIKNGYINGYAETGSLEDVLRKISKYYPEISNTLAILICLVVNHAISYAKIPVTSPQLYVMIDSNFSQEKSFIVKLFTKYMVPENWYANLYNPSMKKIISLFWPRKGVVKPPILVIEDFDYSFINNPVEMHSFISATYDDIPWWTYSENMRSIVPINTSGVSLLAIASRYVFGDASILLSGDDTYKYLLIDILSRMLVVSGRIHINRLLDIPKDIKIVKIIAEKISGHSLAFSKFEFENSSIKNDIIAFCEEKMDENRDNISVKSALSRLYEHTVKIAVAHAVSRLDNKIEESDIDFATDILEKILPLKINMVQELLLKITKDYRERILISRLIRIMKKFKQPVRLREIYRKLGITKEEAKVLLKKVYGEKIRYVYDGRSCLVCTKFGTDDCLSCRYRLQCINKRDIVKMLLRK